MKKKYIIITTIVALISIVLLVFLLVDKKETTQKNLTLANKEKIDSFFAREKKSLETDKPVASISKTTTQYEDIDEADFVKIDDKNLYVVNYESLIILDLQTNSVKKKITIDNFTPTEILLSNNKVILFGMHHTEINLIPGRKVNYYINQCQVYIFDIFTLNMERYFIFEDCYYNICRLEGNVLNMVLTKNNIYNSENKSFIYPKYYDSLYGYQTLEEKNLYIYESGACIYSVNLLAKIDLSSQHPIQAKGLLGVDGIYKINKNHLLISSFLYDDSDKFAVHVLDIDNYNYLGNVVLSGCLINEYAFESYNSYLRVATSHFKDNEMINTLYNISLYDFKIKASLNIAPSETIYSIRFDKNYCYLSTFLYVDPFFLIDFSNPKKIKVIKEIKIDYVNQYLEVLDDEVMYSLGYYMQETGEVYGFVVSLFNKKTLVEKRIFEMHGNNITTEAIYNSKAITKYQDLLIFPVFIDGFNTVLLINKKEMTLLRSLSFNEEYISRNLIYNDFIYSIGINNIFINHLNDIDLCKKIVYKA